MTKRLSIKSQGTDRYVFIERSGSNSPRYPQLVFNNTFNYRKNIVEYPKVYTRVLNTPSIPSDAKISVYPAIDGAVSRATLSYGTTSVRDKGAILKLRNNINSYDFNALVTAMEMRSTIEGISDRVQRLGKAYRALRHGDLKAMSRHLDLSDKRRPKRFPKAQQVQQNAAKHLLEYQFGYVTLTNDIINFGTALYDQSSKSKSVIVRGVSTSRATIEERGFYSSAVVKLSNGKTKGLSTQLLVPKHEVKRRTIASAKCSVENVILQPLSAFGFTNPFAALWAVAPMSWAIDGFLPVGSFLEQLYLPPGIKVTEPRVCVFAASGTKVVAGNTGDILTHRAEWYTANGQYRSSIQKIEVFIHPGTASDVFIQAAPDASVFDIQIPRPKLPFLGQAITLTAWTSLQGQQLKQLIKKYHN